MGDDVLIKLYVPYTGAHWTAEAVDGLPLRIQLGNWLAAMGLPGVPPGAAWAMEWAKTGAPVNLDQCPRDLGHEAGGLRLRLMFENDGQEPYASWLRQEVHKLQLAQSGGVVEVYHSGEPPRSLILFYHCRGLVRSPGTTEPRLGLRHTVRVDMPEKPEEREISIDWLTPIFHPNYVRGLNRIPFTWPGFSLTGLAEGLLRSIQLQDYDLEPAAVVDSQAAREIQEGWVRVPVDQRALWSNVPAAVKLLEGEAIEAILAPLFSDFANQHLDLGIEPLEPERCDLAGGTYQLVLLGDGRRAILFHHEGEEVRLATVRTWEGPAGQVNDGERANQVD